MFRSLRQLSVTFTKIRVPKILKCTRLLCSDNSSVIINPRKYLSTATDSFYSDVDYDGITKGDEDLLKKLKVIMLEVEVIRQSGGRVPQKMTTERWMEVVNAQSKSQRLKQLAFWWMNEKKKENDKERKKAKRLAREESSKTFSKDNGHIFYGFGGNTIFLRIYESTIDRWKNWKLMQAMVFNPTVVIDCGYDSNMNNAELSNCAKQLLILFAENRSHDEPFNLYFCNASRENRLVMKLHKLLPSMYAEDFPVNITEKSYTEMFPKEKLVYLTPHCREELKQFNEDDIYIIGAMVDKVNNEPLSLAKAKSEGLRMAKFPLDHYLDWGIGTKSLTINQSLNIMLDLRRTKGNWEKALAHVPKRKIKTEDEVETLLKKNTFYKPKRSSKIQYKPMNAFYNNNIKKQI